MNISIPIQPPESERELLESATQLTGLTLGNLSKKTGLNIPSNQKYAKGWVGELIELSLGATAASLPEPDFQKIGIELKTLPINKQGKPKESTYVCTVPLTDIQGLNWETSLVYRKLSRVLWVPVEADPDIPFSQRRIGNAFLWSPDAEQENTLRTDWEELMEMVGLGQLDRVSSRFGKILQIRPKAANSRALTKSVTEKGESTQTLPRGFYLRTSFTYEILKAHS